MSVSKSVKNRLDQLEEQYPDTTRKPAKPLGITNLLVWHDAIMHAVAQATSASPISSGAWHGWLTKCDNRTPIGEILHYWLFDEIQGSGRVFFPLVGQHYVHLTELIETDNLQLVCPTGREDGLWFLDYTRETDAMRDKPTYWRHLKTDTSNALRRVGQQISKPILYPGNEDTIFSFLQTKAAEYSHDVSQFAETGSCDPRSQFGRIAHYLVETKSDDDALPEIWPAW